MLKFYSLLDKLDVKISSKQELILKILYKSKMPLSALQIKNIATNKHNFTISMPTIYSILHKLEILQIFIVSYIPFKKTKYYSFKNVQSQSYLVCIKCERFIGFKDMQLNHLLKQSLAKENFILLNYNIALHGVCKKCLNKSL